MERNTGLEITRHRDPDVWEPPDEEILPPEYPAWQEDKDREKDQELREE